MLLLWTIIRLIPSTYPFFILIKSWYQHVRHCLHRWTPQSWERSHPDHRKCSERKVSFLLSSSSEDFLCIALHHSGKESSKRQEKQLKSKWLSTESKNKPNSKNWKQRYLLPDTENWQKVWGWPVKRNPGRDRQNSGRLREKQSQSHRYVGKQSPRSRPQYP